MSAAATPKCSLQSLPNALLAPIAVFNSPIDNLKLFRLLSKTNGTIRAYMDHFDEFRRTYNAIWAPRSFCTWSMDYVRILIHNSNVREARFITNFIYPFQRPWHSDAINRAQILNEYLIKIDPTRITIGDNGEKIKIILNWHYANNDFSGALRFLEKIPGNAYFHLGDLTKKWWEGDHSFTEEEVDRVAHLAQLAGADWYYRNPVIVAAVEAYLRCCPRSPALFDKVLSIATSIVDPYYSYQPDRVRAYWTIIEGYFANRQLGEGLELFEKIKSLTLASNQENASKKLLELKAKYFPSGTK